MTGGPSTYTVNMNGATIHFSAQLTSYPTATLNTTLLLTDLFGATTSAPTFEGSFASVTSAGPYLSSDFPSGISGTLDFTVKLFGAPTVGALSSGQQTKGYTSSGELVPSPEPSSLALVGAGVLSLAGFIRRKIKF